MSIEEELALRLVKQRLPLRQEHLRLKEEVRRVRKQMYNVAWKIKELDEEIDRHLMEVDTNGKV